MSDWYYAKGGTQSGPVSLDQLKEIARNGGISATDLVWTSSMKDWQPAGEVEGLIVQNVVAGQPAHDPSNPYAAPQMSDLSAYGTPSAQVPITMKGGAKFGLWLGLHLGSIGLFLISITLIMFGVYENQNTALTAAGGFLMILALVSMVAATVLFCIILYRAWAGIQNMPHVRSTPGQAVGFMFIPFFNFYWIFVALWRWSEEYNRFVRENNLQGSPPVNEGLFLTACIFMALSMVPLVNYLTMIPMLIIWIICIAQMSKAVNHLWELSRTGTGIRA